MCIKDPIRPEVPEAIRACKTAGIQVYMITGDAKETAVSIAKECGILPFSGKGVVLTGNELEQLQPEKLKELLKQPGGKVFSRVEPSHKRLLVKGLSELVSQRE